VLPIVQQIPAARRRGQQNITHALKHHGVRTARRHAWHNSAVRKLLGRT
jgi:hypothetical protein